MMHSSPLVPDTTEPWREALPSSAPNEPRNSPPAVPSGEVLPVTVDDEIVIVPFGVEHRASVPPPVDALALIVLLTIVVWPSERMPPPTSLAVLPLIVERSS